jgi:hypothetical protein
LNVGGFSPEGAVVFSLLKRLFGCKHRKHSFPFSSREVPTGAYVVCFECGKHLSYDWQAMRISERSTWGSVVPGKST